MRVFESLDAFCDAVGTELGTSEWLTVTQEQIDLFAAATGDHQWIHTDPVRASSGPFGSTIAHGYLTLSLIPTLAESIYRVDGLTMAINFGIERLRFPHPVAVDSRIRATATLCEVEPSTAGTRVRLSFLVEVEGSAKPACVVDIVHVLAA